MKILFASSECAPFAKTGGLGDVIGSLPKALARRATSSVRVALPLYQQIAQKYRSEMKFLGFVYVAVAWRRQYCGIYEYKKDGVIYYFLDNEYYFKRDGIYGFYDDAERFSFFSRAVLEILPFLNWYPDILHAHDWHTALAPLYLDACFRHIEAFRSVRSVVTIHNLQFQGQFGREFINEVIGIDQKYSPLLEYGGSLNILKGGLESANMITTVSRTYANEILDPYYSCGLDSILRARSFKLRGIVNGIDTDAFNPACDTALPANYDVGDLSGKQICRAKLLEELDIEDDDAPVLSVVSRLTDQKGLDLIAARAGAMLDAGMKLIVLGTGDPYFENIFRSLERAYPSSCRALIKFDLELANRIYAGSDIFLMPSKFEPCGLSQMIAMRYGTLPVVRLTGGLVDTVPPFDSTSGEGCGFTFGSFNADDFLSCVMRASACILNPAHKTAAIKNCMTRDFSWSVAAGEYYSIYKEITGKI